MIISASRRCDIPAFHMPWLCQRIEQGFVHVQNPFNAAQMRCVSLMPHDVDGIVFWTKNPAPLLSYEGVLRKYPFYVQATVNPYDQDIEPGVPPLSLRLEALQTLAKRFNPRHVVWRYDPILLSPRYTVDFHIERFTRMAGILKGSTLRVSVSFLDLYRKIQKKVSEQGIRRPSDGESALIMSAFSAVARDAGMEITTCCEPERYGVKPSRCVDANLLSMIGQKPIDAKADPHQREHCTCHKAADIGSYGHCAHQCIYCYAKR